MSKSHENYPTTVKEKRSYKKFRQSRRDVAELKEEFERKMDKEARNLREYLILKGELE